MSEENFNKHTDLKARTRTFSLDIIKLYRLLPKTTEAQIMGKQLLRSGTSVGANTRSAFRGRSKKEFVAKLGIVIEEADESVFWLDLLVSSNILSKDDFITNLISEADQLVSIFISVSKRAKENVSTF